MNSRTRKWLMLGVSLAVAGTWGILRLVEGSSSETPETASKRFLACFDKRDVGCMLEYATEEEKEMLGLTEASLSELLEKFVDPRLRGFNARNTSFMGALMPGASDTRLFRSYLHPDQRRRTYLWTFVKDGLSRPTTEIVPPLIYGTLEDYKHGAKPDSADERHRKCLKELGRALPTLNGLALRGLVRGGGVRYSPPDSGALDNIKASLGLAPRTAFGTGHPVGTRVRGKFQTWEDLVEFHRRALKLESSGHSGGRT